MSKEFDRRMNDWREQIDGCISSLIDDSRYSDEFKDILRYAVFPGGKRLRPILFLEWHSLFAPPDRNALVFASAIELVHAYSLIHDDMPCMDDSDVRRGKPSVHKAFGEGKALLAGDALLTLAFKAMTQGPDANSRVTACVAAQLCGDCGIIEGQWLDLYAKIDGIDALLECYRKKTAALITLACSAGYAYPIISSAAVESSDAAGAISCDLGGAGEAAGFMTDHEARIVSATKFGNAFGTAFQIYDDLSECIAGEQPDGKNILDFVPLDEAKLILNKFLNDAVAQLDGFSDSDTLRELVRRFVIV